MDEEILALKNIAHWLKTYEDEFQIPKHYKDYALKAAVRIDALKSFTQMMTNVK